MKITFDKDDSFLEILPSEDQITFIMCGHKSFREVTMSSAELSKEQVSEIIAFLSEWIEERE
jgi:hypothetical protein